MVKKLAIGKKKRKKPIIWSRICMTEEVLLLLEI